MKKKRRLLSLCLVLLFVANSSEALVTRTPVPKKRRFTTTHTKKQETIDHGHIQSLLQQPSWHLDDIRVIERYLDDMGEQIMSHRSSSSSSPASATRSRPTCQHPIKRTTPLVLESVLHRIVLEQENDNIYADRLDMTRHYCTLIQWWSACHYPARAHAILLQLHEAAQAQHDCLLCGADAITWNGVLESYSVQNQIKEAIALLGVWYDLYQSGNTNVLPNSDSYAAILKGRALSGRATAPETVLRNIQHLEQLSKQYSSIDKPNHTLHHLYLVALNASMQSGSIDGKEATETAHTYLLDLIQTNNDTDLEIHMKSESYEVVVNMLAHSGLADSLPRAQQLREILEANASHKHRPPPPLSFYNTLLIMYSTHCHKPNLTTAERAQSILTTLQNKIHGRRFPGYGPDTTTYTLVMAALVKGRVPDAARKVEHYLHEMQSKGLMPTKRTLNVCCQAWAKSNLPNAHLKIRGWIDTMLEWGEAVGGERHTVGPDIWSYTHLLQAISKCGIPNMGEMAEAILDEMETLHRQHGYTNLTPNVLTYTNAIHCHAKSQQEDSIERALALLDRMEDWHSCGYGDVSPNQFTYNSVINTIAKSKRRGKARMAVQLLRRIQSVALKPVTVSFNNVLNSCAFSSHEDDPVYILQTAMSILKEAQEGPGANWITYQTAIRVVCTFESNPETRRRLTEQIFLDCIADKQLTKTVLSQVRFAMSEGQFAKLEQKVTNPKTKKLLVGYTVNACRSLESRSTQDRCVPKPATSR